MAARSAWLNDARFCASALCAERAASRSRFSVRLRLGRRGLGGLLLGGGAVSGLLEPVELGFEPGQAVALGKPARGGAWRVGGGHEAVPAPEVAFLGDEALAGAEPVLKPVALGLGGNDADLREAARQLQRPANESRKPLGALGQGRVARGVADEASSAWARLGRRLRRDRRQGPSQALFRSRASRRSGRQWAYSGLPRPASAA